MSIKHRIFNERLSSTRYTVLFVLLAFSLFFCIAENAAIKTTAAANPMPTPTPTPDPMGCAPSSVLKDKGCWATSFAPHPIVHATVLPNGSVLNWSSFEPHAYARIWDCNLIGDSNKQLCERQVTTNNNHYFFGVNLFCSGHSLLKDGKVIITGGVAQANRAPEFAEERVTIFNWENLGTATSPWSISSSTTGTPATMYEGRWYPTNVALGNGGTLVASGTYLKEAPAGPTPTPTPQTVSNNIPELLPDGGTSWTKLTGAELGLPLYPWLYYASSGKVFYAGPTRESRWLDTSSTGSWSLPLLSSIYRESGSSVMYEVDKIMVSGGGPVSPLATNEVIDLATTPIPTPTPTPSASPTPAPTPDRWRPVAPMAFARKHHNLTILADGKILASGGTKGIGFNNNCERQVVYEAEIWTPSTGPSDPGSWATMAKMSYNRRYHSAAVLLRDGRVLVAGSDQYPSLPVQCSPALPFSMTSEIFTPPYLFNPDGSGALAVRPEVTDIPGSGAPGTIFNISYGTNFNVDIADAAMTIPKVTMIRLSSTTHSFNMGQRINYLTVSKSGSTLTITPPANSNLAPPGHYFLFIVNSAGVPSVGEVVKIS